MGSNNRGSISIVFLAGGLFAVRYILSVMLSLSCFLVYAMRLNLSVAITAMVNESTHDVIPLANESCRSSDAVVNHTGPSKPLAVSEHKSPQIEKAL